MSSLSNHSKYFFFRRSNIGIGMQNWIFQLLINDQTSSIPQEKLHHFRDIYLKYVI